MHENHISKLRIQKLVTALIAIVTISGSLILWQTLNSWERAEFDRRLGLKAASVKDDIKDNVESRINSLIRMANRLELKALPDRKEWEADAGLYFKHDLNYKAVTWVDTSLNVRWSVPPGLDNTRFNLTFPPGTPQRDGLRKALESKSAVFTGLMDFKEGRGHLICIPLFRKGREAGFIVAAFKTQDFLDNILLAQREPNDYYIEVIEGEDGVYSSDPGSHFDKGLGSEASIELYGLKWRIRVWPREGYISSIESSIPEVTLLLGLLASVMLSAAFYFWQTSYLKGKDIEAANMQLKKEFRERERAEKRIVRLNRLYSVLTKVNEAIVRLREPQELYEQVCQIAVEEGKFRMTWVGLIERGEDEIRPAAYWGVEEGYLKDAGISISDTPRGKGPTGSAIREGRYVICEDFETDPRMGPWRAEALKRGYRSSAAFPLMSGGKVVGAFTLYAGEPDFFDAEQVQLLKSLSSDISFAIESADVENSRRRAEEELKKYKERLEELVEERTAELKALNEKLRFEVTVRKSAEDAITQMNKIVELRAVELESVNKELEAFTYSASHDLQEPLRVVAGYVQLLGKRYKGRLDKDADEFIAYAVDGVGRMQRLINDLLSYSRIGRVKEFAAVDCEKVLKNAVADLKLLIAESGATVTHSPLPAIPADASQLLHLFMNLIGNSIKYRSNEPPLIRISAQAKGAEWLFAFKDNGIGIDPKYFDRIFEIFQRLHGKGEYPGSGIGLSICKKVAENHGGRIWVESQPGEGSVFYFTIPMREVENEPQKQQ